MFSGQSKNRQRDSMEGRATLPPFSGCPGALRTCNPGGALSGARGPPVLLPPREVSYKAHGDILVCDGHRAASKPECHRGHSALGTDLTEPSERWRGDDKRLSWEGQVGRQEALLPLVEHPPEGAAPAGRRRHLRALSPRGPWCPPTLSGRSGSEH